MCQAERRGASDKVSLAEAIWISWVLLFELFGGFFLCGFGLVSKTNCVMCSIDLRSSLQNDQISASVVGVCLSLAHSVPEELPLAQLVGRAE